MCGEGRVQYEREHPSFLTNAAEAAPTMVYNDESTSVGANSFAQRFLDT